jgi:hypothetical protein
VFESELPLLPNAVQFILLPELLAEAGDEPLPYNNFSEYPEVVPFIVNSPFIGSVPVLRVEVLRTISVNVFGIDENVTLVADDESTWASIKVYVFAIMQP